VCRFDVSQPSSSWRSIHVRQSRGRCPAGAGCWRAAREVEGGLAGEGLGGGRFRGGNRLASYADADGAAVARTAEA
jgi:hypothetical protein